MRPGQVDDRHRPALNALVAYRLGVDTDEHQYAILADLMIAEAIARTVQRHQHLLPDILAARDATMCRTGNHDTVELGCAIARALTASTTRKMQRRALAHLKKQLESQEKLG